MVNRQKAVDKTVREGKANLSKRLLAIRPKKAT